MTPNLLTYSNATLHIKDIGIIKSACLYNNDHIIIPWLAWDDTMTITYDKHWNSPMLDYIKESLRP